MFTRRIARNTATQVNSDKIGVQIKLGPVPEPPVEAITVDYGFIGHSCSANFISGEQNELIVEFENCIYRYTGNTTSGKYDYQLLDVLEGHTASEYEYIYMDYRIDAYDDDGNSLLVPGDTVVYTMDDGNFVQIGTLQCNISSNNNRQITDTYRVREISENMCDDTSGNIYDIVPGQNSDVSYLVSHNSSDVVLVLMDNVEDEDPVNIVVENAKFNKVNTSNGKTEWRYTWNDTDNDPACVGNPAWPNLAVNFNIYTDSERPEANDTVYVGGPNNTYNQLTVKEVFPQKFAERPTMDYFDSFCTYINYTVKKDNDYDKYSVAQIEWTTDDGNGNNVQNYMKIIVSYNGSDTEYDGVTYRMFGVVDVENNSGPAWMWGPYYENNDLLYILHQEWDEQNQDYINTMVYAGKLIQAFSIEGNFRKTYNDPTVVCEVENASSQYNFINWGTNTMLVIDGTDLSNSNDIGIVVTYSNVTTSTSFVLSQNQSWNGMVEWWPAGITTVFDLDNSQYAPVWTYSTNVWKNYIWDVDGERKFDMLSTMVLTERVYSYDYVSEIKWAYPAAPSPYIPPEPETYNCTVSYSVTGEGFTDHPTALTDENNVIVNIPKYVYLKFSQDVEITEE